MKRNELTAACAAVLALVLCGTAAGSEGAADPASILTISYSYDGADWTALEGTWEEARYGVRDAALDLDRDIWLKVEQGPGCVGGSVTDLSVGWQCETGDPAVTAYYGYEDAALGTPVKVPAALLGSYGGYDGFFVDFHTDLGYPCAFGTYHLENVFQGDERNNMDLDRLLEGWLGTYTPEADGPQLSLKREEGRVTAAISDEVTAQGAPASTAWSELYFPLENDGSARAPRISFGYGVRAYFTLEEAESAKTLTADETYTYRTRDGEHAGRISEGAVFTQTPPVAEVEGVQYLTLAEAIAAVPKQTAEPVTVTLLDDAVGGVRVGAGLNMILDLGGHALSVDQGVGSTGTETNGVQLLRGSTVVIQNGTLKVGAAEDIKFIIKNYCDLTLEDVTVDAEQMVPGLATAAVNNCGQLLLKGEGNRVIHVPAGNYGISTGNYHYKEDIHTVIEGGRIDSVYTEGNAWVSSPDPYDGELVKTEIKGGEIGAVGMYTWGDTKPLNWQFVISDTAVVENNHFAAKTGTGYYASLADAAAAAADGGTVTLLNDVSVSAPVAVRKDLTIDGGGHTLTGVPGGSGGERQGMFHLDNAERAVAFTLRDADLVNKKSWPSASGISVQASGQTVRLDKVTMDTAYYCVIAGVLTGDGSEKLDDITLTIRDSKLTGYAAVYYRTNSTTDTINDPVLTITGSELYGRGVSGYGNGFAAIVYNGTRGARTTIADSVLSNNFDGGNADADEGVIMFNSYGAYEKDAQVVIRDSTIKTASDSSAPNVIKYVCTQNLNAGNKVIIDHLTLTRGETGTDLIRVMRDGTQLVATGVDLKAVLETSVYDDSTWEGDTAVYYPLLQGGETVLVPIDLTISEHVAIPAGVTVKVQPGAALTVAKDVAVTGGGGSKLIVEGTVAGLAGVGAGTYHWSGDQWVRESSGSGGGGGGSTTKPPKTETETETEGGVKKETTTTTTKNKDGSTTTDTRQTSTNEATGEKSESKVTETVAKDGSTVREEVRTTTAADGTRTEETTLAMTDKATGAATTARVVTDAAGRTTATARTEAKAETKVDENGAATASVDAKTAEKLVAQAKAAAEAAKGADKVNQSVVIAAPAEKAGSVAVEVPRSLVEGLAGTAAAVVVDTPIAAVTVPNGALSALAEDALTVKAEAVGDGAVAVTLSVGGSALEAVAGGLRAALPAETATAGTVAVLVGADGTETVIRKSVAADGMVTLPLSGSATVRLEERGRAFADTQAHWAGESVAFVTARDLFQGVDADRFAPDQPMSRGMLVTVLSRLEYEPEAPAAEFRDVPDGAWYTRAVAWAAEQGIVTGMGDGSFAPDASITREQLATFLYRYAQAQGLEPEPLGDVAAYPDGGAVSDWAADAMAYAVGAGLMTGKETGALDPAGPATRAETAAVLQRLIRSQG